MNESHEIITVVDDTAHDLAQVLPNVGELRCWVVYLLEALEAETQDLEEYEQMLTDLVTDVSLRIDSGRW
jgi:hypothetical protein